MDDDPMEENQHLSPLLDPSLAPVLLFEPGHGGADEAGDETTDDDDDDGTRFLYSIPKRQLLAVAGGFDYLSSDTTWITPQGWVLVLDPSTRDASLRDPFTSRTVRLPSDQQSLLPSNEHTRCLLSTPRPAATADDDPGGCTVLLVHLEEPVLWYCSSSPGGSRWLRHEFPSELIAGDHDTVMGAMGSLTLARGKFYTHTFGDGYYDKLVTLEFSPGPIFSSTHVARTPPLSRFCEIRLVESCGDLFFLRISLEPLCLCAQGITEINVYKLVLSSSENAWVKVEVPALGDNRVFFSGSCGDGSYEFGASMAADEVGLKANCIYFTHGADKGLYVHDLERGTTTLHNPGTDVPDSVKPVLLMHAIL